MLKTSYLKPFSYRVFKHCISSDKAWNKKKIIDSDNAQYTDISFEKQNVGIIHILSHILLFKIINMKKGNFFRSTTIREIWMQNKEKHIS